MKKIILSVIIISLSIQLKAQKQERLALLDSLTAKLAVTKEDTAKVNLLNTIAFEYISSDMEKSNDYAEKSLALAIQIHFKKGEADAYNVLGKIHHENYSQKKAIDYYKKAIDISQHLNDQKTLAKNYYRLANVYNDMNNYASALEYYFSAVNIYEQTEESKNTAIIYCQISTIYRGLNDFEKAEKYLKLSTALLTKSNSTRLLIYNYISYAQLYERMNEIEKVEYYAKKSYALAVKHNDQNNIAVSLFALGVVKKERKLYDEAIANINKSLTIFQTISNFMGAANAHNELGICHFEIYKKTKNISHLVLAKEHYTVSNKLYKEGNLIDGLADNYLALSQINEIEGDYKKGLENYKLYFRYNDSIVKTSNKETIRNLEDKRTIELRDKEIQLSKLTLEAREKQKWLYIGGILLMGVIGTLLFYQSRNRQKTNEKLQLLNTELDQANKVKTRFFSILNHDLRSPVANLIHFLHLQKDNPELMDEATKNRMQNKTILGAENLLSSMEDILLWSKGQMENFKPEPKKVTVHQLFEDNKKVFSGYHNIIFDYQNPDSVELLIDENYLKTIIRNLTSNAINIFTTTPNPTIIWKAWQDNGKSYLSISDNGPGASQEQFKALYDDKEVVGIKSGLGLHLIRDLAKAIDCEIAVDSKIGKGTTFTLKL